MSVMAFSTSRIRPYYKILLLAVATFATFLSTNLIKPVLPVLAEELGGEEFEIASVLMISIVLLSLLQPLTGALADKYGYVKMIVIGGFLGGFTSLLCIFAASWRELFILRAIGGLADAISGPAILAIAASLSEERRGLTFGIFRSSQGLSFMVGPIVGAVLAEFFSIKIPFLFDFALSLLAITLFAISFKEGARRLEEKTSFKALVEVARDRELLKIAYLGFSEGFSFTIWSSFLPVYMLSLGMAETEIGLVFSLEALAFSLSNIFIGYLSDRIGRKPLALLGATLTTFSSIAYIHARSLFPITVLSIFYGMGCSSIFLLSTVMAADRIPENRRALLLGAFDTIMDIGLAVGPVFSWVLLKTTGLPLITTFIVMALSTGLAVFAVFLIKNV